MSPPLLIVALTLCPASLVLAQPSAFSKTPSQQTDLLWQEIDGGCSVLR